MYNHCVCQCSSIKKLLTYLLTFNPLFGKSFAFPCFSIAPCLAVFKTPCVLPFSRCKSTCPQRKRDCSVVSLFRMLVLGSFKIIYSSQIGWKNHTTVDDTFLKSDTKQNVLITIRRRQLHIFGHVMRKDEMEYLFCCRENRRKGDRERQGLTLSSMEKWMSGLALQSM